MISEQSRTSLANSRISSDSGDKGVVAGASCANGGKVGAPGAGKAVAGSKPVARGVRSGVAENCADESSNESSVIIVMRCSTPLMAVAACAVSGRG